MGRKKGGNELGRTLIKNRFKGRRHENTGDATFPYHTADLDDGFDWGRLNLQSVTEQSNLDDFLATAELAGTEFTAERLNVSFVNPKVGENLPSPAERAQVALLHEKNKHYLQIPRRPSWDAKTTGEELQERERESFLAWRRQLAELQESEGVIMTPFEKNLEFWRQLWRVVERSDVVVQIVDARNPLLFRCEDLERYVKESSEEKLNMILVNKSDLLTPTQREIWADYFESCDLTAVFFSALKETEVLDAESDSSNDDEDDETEYGKVKVKERDGVILNEGSKKGGKGGLCDKESLIEIFKTIHKGKKLAEQVTTVGLVGYPNVGKSSTINALLTEKKVSVSATPGKTKHFQTIFIDDSLCLCDCPGLVMPTFVSTAAEMVVSGILPIDQMRDHVGPINLLAERIPRHVLEKTYGIIVKKPLEGEDPNRPPTSEEILNAYGYMRGMMTQRGLPDNSRAARYVLKDFVKGKLLFCHAPPQVDQDNFQMYPNEEEKCRPEPTPLQKKVEKANIVTVKDLDQSFFKQVSMDAHQMRKPKLTGRSDDKAGSQVSLSTISAKNEGKPWKKHNNRNKKEKLRRVFNHLDN